MTGLWQFVENAGSARMGKDELCVFICELLDIDTEAPAWQFILDNSSRSIVVSMFSQAWPALSRYALRKALYHIATTRFLQCQPVLDEMALLKNELCFSHQSMNRLRDKFPPTDILGLASDAPELCSAQSLQDLFQTAETMNKFSESHRLPHATAFESSLSYVQLVRALRDVPKPPLSVDVEGVE